MQAISTANAEHYTWGGVCDGWHLARHESLSVIEERMPPGASEREHHHERARQFFYVLRGTLSLEVSGRTISVPPRSGVEIAPGERHRAFNAGGEAVEFILVSTPPTRGDRIETNPSQERR